MIEKLLTETIAADRIESVLAAIAAVYQGKLPECFSVLTGGYSNSKTFKMRQADKTLVLRVMSFDHDLYDRQQQINCLQQAAAAGIAPLYHFANAELGIVIMDFIPAIDLQSHPHYLQAMALVLQKLHAMKAGIPGYGDLFSYMALFNASLANFTLAPILQDYLARLDVVKQLLTPHLINCFCHNDLNGNNILFDGQKIFLIDWEAGGSSDPYFDLAAFCNQLALTAEKENIFLQSYFVNSLDEFKQAKFFLMKQIAYCYQAIHFLDFAAKAGESLADDTLFANLPSYCEWLLAFRNHQVNLDTPKEFAFYAVILIYTSLQQLVSPQYGWAVNSMQQATG